MLHLDEWTQRQIDAMRIGGNGNAKKFFRKHGCTDFHTKTEKKYTSKAAVAYRAELEKLVDAEAVKRGEGLGSTSSSGGTAGSLFDNADASMQKNMEDEARNKLNAARANGSAAASAGVLQPSAKLASQMSGAKGRLTTPTGTPLPTPPPSGGLANGALKKPSSSSGGPKLVLRKPTTSSSNSRMMKKGSSLSAASKLRVNKVTSSCDDGGFEDVETTQQNIKNQKKEEEDDKKRRDEEDEKLARELEAQLNGLGNGSNEGTAAATTTTSVEPATPTSTPANGIVAPAAAVEQPKPKVSAMEENMKKLSSMNSDFFSGL